MRKRANPTETVEVPNLRRAIEAEREASRGLQRQLQTEVQVARRAAEQVLKARAEREEYRRVLAAAIASEKRALARTEQVSSELTSSQEALRRAVRERGLAEGRAEELALRFGESEVRHARELKAADDRNWALREEHAGRLGEELHKRGMADGRVEELLTRVPHDAPASARAALLRGRLGLGAAAVCAALALVFLPAAGLALFTGERARYVELAVGLEGWQLLGLVALLVALALALATLGVRDLRGSERSALRETRDRLDGGHGSGADPGGDSRAPSGA